VQANRRSMSEGDPDPDAGDDEDAPDSDGAGWPPNSPENWDETVDSEPPENEAEDEPPEDESEDEPADSEPPEGDGESESDDGGADGQPGTSDDEDEIADTGEAEGPSEAGDSEDWGTSGDATVPGPDTGPGDEDTLTTGYGERGAPDDQEMPLTEHVEEMVRRLAVVILVMALVSAVVLPLADRFINFLWYSFLPGPPTECVQSAAALPTNITGMNASAVNATGVNVTTANATGTNVTNVSNALGSSGGAACPRLYHPLALVFSRLKMASLGGFVMALPVFVYETYLFMRPGLYPNERRYYLASVPTSLILAGIGLAFAYFLVLPIIFIYFLGYSQPVAEVAFGLTKTFNLILLMMGMFALIFQIPLFVMLAIMMGVTSRTWLEARRLYFWFGFGGVAFIFSPDPTGMAPFIVAATMILLFEGTLLLLRWTGR
jgi:sec-independent protein translocase protein TatC